MTGAATQIASREFDADFLRLAPDIRDRIQAKIDEMGTRLAIFPHYKMTASDRYRLRVGDYRVIYRFDTLRMRFTSLPSAIAAKFTDRKVQSKKPVLYSAAPFPKSFS